MKMDMDDIDRRTLNIEDLNEVIIRQWSTLQLNQYSNLSFVSKDSIYNYPEEKRKIKKNECKCKWFFSQIINKL